MASHSVLVGGALVRNNIHPVLAGEGAECLINGLFMAAGRQHMDNYMKVEHASPHCDSRQFYHGILDGRSRGVFHGRIVVHKGARVRYTTIQNWSVNVYNLVTKRAVVEADGVMEWIDCNLGSAVTMKYPSVYLMEPGAKGDVLSVARLAGIMGAKRTPDLIPLCHPLLITGVDIDFKEDPQPNREGLCSITATATVKTTGQTGVEMEALTAVTVAGLTLYDMLKAVERGARLTDVRLVAKSGGRSGDYRAP